MGQLELNHKAIAEANAVAAPFVRTQDEARLAYEQAEAVAESVWREAYAVAVKAPRNQ